MKTIICFIACSLDGYIADEEGKLDWLMNVPGEGDNGFQAFYDTVDTILIGRKTFDHVMNLVGGVYPHAEKTTYIFTRQPDYRIDSSACGPHTYVVLQDVIPFVKQLKENSGQPIWLVGGSEWIAELEQAQLIDEWIITIAPIRLGSGIPLWRTPKEDVTQNWELVSHQVFGQFLQIHYRAMR